MGKIARMSRWERRDLVRRGRRSGEPQTALRFLAIARLGAGRSTVQVAEELEVARSTVIAAADRFTRLGVEGLYDLRHFNGMQKRVIRWRAARTK